MPEESLPKLVGRPPEVQEKILAAFRRQIINGTISPGQRLPSRNQVASKYRVSPVTAHQVFTQLADDGYVVAHGPRGTFVTDHPPHLHHFALVMPMGDASAPPRYTLALAQAAGRLDADESPIQVSTFLNIDGRPDNEDYVSFTRQVLRHCFAGLIFASVPDLLRETPLLTAEDIPRVTMASEDRAVPGMATIHAIPTYRGALDDLKSRGCQRIAVLTCRPEPHHQSVRDAAAQRGMSIPPYWCHRISLACPRAARNIAHLMMQTDQSRRPDGLIIEDDHLVEPATEGLFQAGVRAGAGLHIVAHANFPMPPTSVLPVRRLGYDMRQAMQLAVDQLVSWRTEGRCPAPVRLEPTFENEIAAPGAAISSQDSVLIRPLSGHEELGRGIREDDSTGSAEA